MNGHLTVRFESQDLDIKHCYRLTIEKEGHMFSSWIYCYFPQGPEATGSSSKSTVMILLYIYFPLI